MPTPPIPVIGAVITAVRASSTLAAEVVQGVSEKVGAFAGVLTGDEQVPTSDANSIAAESISAESDPNSATRSVSEIIKELSESLGLSFEEPVELAVDGNGQISVYSESGFSDQDFDSRIKLQAHINGDESVRTQLAQLLTQPSSEK